MVKLLEGKIYNKNLTLLLLFAILPASLSQESALYIPPTSRSSDIKVSHQYFVHGRSNDPRVPVLSNKDTLY